MPNTHHLPIYFGRPIDTPSGRYWAGEIGTAVRIEGDAGPLFGRTGRVLARASYPYAAGVWVITLDPSTDPIPGDYMPRGGTVTVRGGALVVQQ